MLAKENISRLRSQMLSLPNFDARLVDSLLPELPTIDVLSEEARALSLYTHSYTDSKGIEHDVSGVFMSRSDYENTLAYLERINREAALAFADQPSTLTSFVQADSGIETEFMARETQYYVQRQNSRRRKKLEEEGIHMVQVPVYHMNEDGDLVQSYTPSGRKLMQWVAETPNQQAQYTRMITEQQDLRVMQPVIPEGSYITQFGDLKQAETTGTRHYSARKIAQSLTSDYLDALRVEGYFANMQEVVDTVLPDYMSDELDRLFEAIQQESPERMQEIYRAMAGKGEYSGLYNEDEPTITIMTLDYLYPDIGLSPFKNVQLLVNNLNNIVLPMLSREIEPIGELQETELSIEEMHDMEGGNFAGIYQRIKGGRGHGITYPMLRSYRGRKED